MSGKYKAASVANWFIEEQKKYKDAQKNEKENDNLPPMDQFRLIKLVYVAHGYYLALTGSPLIKEKVEAWMYGPVIADLYHKIKQHGYQEIDKKIDEPGAQIEPSDESLLRERIWEKYKWYAGTELSMLTHERNTPWEGTIQTKGKGPGIVIAEKWIKAHYKGIMNDPTDYRL